jgi:hypothetical protein
MISSHLRLCFRSDRFYSGFAIKILHVFIVSAMCAVCRPFRPPQLDHHNSSENTGFKAPAPPYVIFSGEKYVKYVK